MSLISCEKTAPRSLESTTSEKPAATDPTLAAAQFSHAKTLLANGSPYKALAYLAASSDLDPSQEKAEMIGQALSSQKLSVPTLDFTHPYPVTAFESSDDALFVAMGGTYPTVIRWNTSLPEEQPAILFPVRSEPISNISLSPNGEHLIVHRGDTNLLCLARTLKPISALDTFPKTLDPAGLQPFTANSLLVATPSLAGNRLTWHICDTTTGEELSSASLPAYPSPVSARFSGNDLLIHLQNQDDIIISPLGEITRNTGKPGSPRIVRPHPPNIHFSAKDNVVTQWQNIPSSPKDSDLLDAVSGWKMNPDSQELEAIPVPNRLPLLHQRFPEISSTLRIFSAETVVKSASPQPSPSPSLKFPRQSELVQKS